jgi:hypothetical protein
LKRPADPKQRLFQAIFVIIGDPCVQTFWPNPSFIDPVNCAAPDPDDFTLRDANINRATRGA